MSPVGQWTVSGPWGHSVMDILYTAFKLAVSPIDEDICVSVDSVQIVHIDILLKCILTLYLTECLGKAMFFVKSECKIQCL